MSDTTHYALSQDYEQMFVLLENGPLLGFVDYEHGSTLRDPVQIKRVADGKYFEYRAGVRGFGYINAFSKDAKDKFVEQCRKYNLSFIVPNADAEARAEELEEYIAKLVSELTDGKLSKPYDISVITDEVESIYRAYYEDEISKATAKTEAENARLRERLEAALDKIADIEEDSNAYTSEGACHACGICADCPQDWQPTDDHNCRVMLELWADGEPLPWEAARRVGMAESEVKG